MSVERIPLVLIVDDEPTVREVLLLLFETFGMRAETAAGGQEALALAAKLEPDVVVTDLHMPRMHGTELARRLTERLEAPPPVVATSADTHLVEQLQGAPDFFAVLSKPVNPTRLVATVTRAMSAYPHPRGG